MDLWNRDLAREMAARGLDDLWVRHLDVIRRISPAGNTVTELAGMAGLSKQTVGPVVRELERAGIAVVGPHPDDGRARLIRLAAAGTSGMERANHAVRELTAQYRSRMGAEGLDELEEGLWLMLDTR